MTNSNEEKFSNQIKKRNIEMIEEVKFHPLANLFPLMNSEELDKLGKDILESGQQDDIILLDGMILDGRNTYLSCRMFKIKPRFKNYNKKTKPLQYVKSKNLYRRHLNSAQKAEIALQFLELEREKAKKRKMATQFNGRDKNNKPKLKRRVGDLGLPTVKNYIKGRAMDILAKEFTMSPKTLRKSEKIKKVAENDPKVKEQWEQAKQNKDSIENIYRGIRKKENEELNKRKNALSRRLKKKDNSIQKSEETVENCFNCQKIRASTCPHCLGQILACLRDMTNGRLVIKKPNTKKCEDSPEQNQ